MRGFIIYTLDMYTRDKYNMIKSIKDKETLKVYNRIFSTKLPQDIQAAALRKLIR